MSYLDPFIRLRDPVPPTVRSQDDERAERAFYDKQASLLGHLYSESAELKRAALARYEANIASLTDMQRDTWHANSIDPDRFGIYSDLHKDEYGIRPRWHVSLKEMTEFLDARRSKAA